MTTLEEYARRAVDVGDPILSSCNHGTPGNFRKCATIAEKYGLKWRYVVETYFVKDRNEKDNKNCHLILAAKTAKGIGDINEAISEANVTGYYYRARIDREILYGLNPRDVFVTTACVAGVYKYGFDDAEELIEEMHEHFRDSLMLEVQYHDTEKQKEINRFLLQIYRKRGIPLIMGMDSHYIHEKDSILRDQRLAANNINYEDESGWIMHYPTEDEARQLFLNQGILSPSQINEAINNTNVFVDFEDVVFDKSKKLPNIYPDLSQEERNQKYRDLVDEKWKEFSEGMTAEEKRVREEGIKYEVDTITSTNTSDYFLVANKVVEKAVKNGGIITPTGRGSGVSYFTNTLLGFSSVDRFAAPVEMFPDRFISADRLKSGALPDLD